MWRGRGARRNTPLETATHPYAAMAISRTKVRNTDGETMSATTGFPDIRRPSEVFPQTGSAFMTCMAICGNGWRIAGMPVTTMRRRTDPRGVLGGNPGAVARSAFCAAGHGSAHRRTSGRRTASRPSPANGATSPGFVLPGRSRNSEGFFLDPPIKGDLVNCHRN